MAQNVHPIRARAGALAGELGRRSHQVRRIVGEHGVRELAAFAAQGLADRMHRTASAMPVRIDDVQRADLAHPRPTLIPPVPPDGRLTVNWVTTPLRRGSGGHTTMARLIEHLEAVGHTCRIYLYDTYGSRAADHVREARAAFPRLRATIHDVTHGMADAHAVFATAWMTAYPVFHDPCAGKRFYLVQDYEPWFFPAGAYSALADNTYRMGFHGFTAGRFLAEKLRGEHGMDADWFDFGCDTKRYRLLPGVRRDGVAFYARRDADRRAFELGRIALELFSRRHPDCRIHLYGRRTTDLGGNVVNHGLLDPDALNALYNRSHAGLSLSMTNVSLVPHEMLAAGCIPVVNDAEHNRIVLDNPHVRYTPADPHSLAKALGDIVENPLASEAAAAVSGSVASRSWADAGVALDAVLRREIGADVGLSERSTVRSLSGS